MRELYCFHLTIDFSANSVRGKSCNDVIPVSQSAARSASESCQGRSKINVLFPLSYCSLQSLALSQTFYSTSSSAPASSPNCRINMFVVNLQTFGKPVDSVVSRISVEGGCTPEGFGERVPGVLTWKIKKKRL